MFRMLPSSLGVIARNAGEVLANCPAFPSVAGEIVVVHLGNCAGNSGGNRAGSCDDTVESDLRRALRAPRFAP